LLVQPIELKVPMCCEKCVKKVKDKLLDMDGKPHFCQKSDNTLCFTK